MPPSKASKETTGPSKSKADSASTNGTATPASTSDVPAVSAAKPDKKAYDQEQDRVKGEIDTLQASLSAVRDKISLATKSGPGNERRNALRTELDSIRNQQSTNKVSRGKLIDQVKSLQDGIDQKIKTLNAARGKTPFKTVADVDAHIKQLEKQVESGSMKLADEKRALQDISQSKRTRRTVEGFQADQGAIEADRKTIEELRKQLDDPEAKAASERFTDIKSQLDALKKEEDEAYAGRSKLFEERDSIQAKLNDLFNQKRSSAQQYREANDRYWNKVNEDRARRAERARTQRAEEEAEKKKEVASRLREEAEVPAFQAQIEDCRTLIDYFTGKTTGQVTLNSGTPLSPKQDVVGVPKLEIRQVEGAPEGAVARKKKADDEESYFVGGKGKAKGKKGSKGAPETNGAAAAGSNLNVPLPTLSALLTLSIPPPSSSNDVPRLIEDLKTKKAWFEANQSRVTSENIAKADADIKRLLNTTSQGKEDASSSSLDVAPPNGGGERPAEPAPTPQKADLPSVAVPSEEVVDKLESVAESQADS